MSNINPDIKPTKKMPLFKGFCLNNFPFIDEDFDALTNYELMCKIIEYLNGVIKETNNCNDNVTALYDAFMSLQESVEEQIEEGFSELNVQEEVNAKLDEMVESGELNQAIFNAIQELDPTILDTTNYMNVVDFDAPFCSTYGLSYITANFKTIKNGELIINIINDMLEKEKHYYYFINPLDSKAVLYHYIYVDDITDGFFIYTKIDYPNIDIAVNDEYVDHAYFLTSTLNGKLLDFTYSETTDRTNMLASKSYVQDAVLKFAIMPQASEVYLSKIVQFIGTTTSNYKEGYFYKCILDGSVYSWKELNISQDEFYSMNAQDNSTFILFNGLGSYNFGTNDLPTFMNILEDANSKGYKSIILSLLNSTISPNPSIYNISLNSFSLSGSTTNVVITEVLDTQNINSILTYGVGNNGGAYHYKLTLAFNVSDNHLASIDSGNSSYSDYSNTYLSTSNTYAYTPTASTHPATKGFVEGYATPKYSTMPSASSSNLGLIAQYVGATDSTYTAGHFYQVVTDGVDYSWEEISFGGGGGGNLPVVYFIPNGTDFAVDYVGTLSNADRESIKNIANNILSQGYTGFLFMVEKQIFGGAKILYTYIASITTSQPSYNLIAIKCIGTNNPNEKLSNIGSQNVYQLTGSVTDGVITNINANPNSSGSANLLYTNNNISYTPTGQYNPATKGYVDGYLATITGYDATKTQTLKNVSGTLTWVDD